MRFWLIMMWLLGAGAAWGEPPDRACSTPKWGQPHCILHEHFIYDTCNAMRIFADRHGLNRDFFARLIWQESRLDPNALSHADARGIAQFIPSTARLRGLKDPFNPADALEHSAQYLAEMTRRYGNEGMAAIGYNGGERRAEKFLDGGGLAIETINYVPIVTGLTAGEWRDTPPKTHDFRLSKTDDFHTACTAMAQNRRLTPVKIIPLLNPWGVQMAFGKTGDEARAAFKRQTAQCRGTVAKEKPDFIPVKHRAAGKKGFVMARIGRNTRYEADKLCSNIRAGGCICAVYKNPR